MRCPTSIELPPPPPGKTSWPWTEETAQLPDTMPDGRPWPRVSIVTPSYNQGQFIEETIRSVLLQGYPNLEYIIIDGGSTDGSIEIIRRYDKHLAYWISEPDKGQADAINKGWRRASGTIVAYLNSDDIYRPKSIAEVVQAFLSQPAVGCVYGECDVINEEGMVIGELGKWEFDLHELIGMGESSIPQPATFVSSEALDVVGMLDPQLHFAMDYDLWIKIGLKYPIFHVPKTLAAFRVHTLSKSIVTDLLVSRPDVIRIMHRLMNDKTLSPKVRGVSRMAYLSTSWRLEVARGQCGWNLQVFSCLLLTVIQSRCRVPLMVWLDLGSMLLGYRTARFLDRAFKRLIRTDHPA